MCLAVSRMLFQMQPKTDKWKNFEVKRNDLSEMVNVSSLKLERINGMLAKKQDQYVKVESVNTDAFNDIPPGYLGLSDRKTTINNEE